MTAQESNATKLLYLANRRELFADSKAGEDAWLSVVGISTAVNLSSRSIEQPAGVDGVEPLWCVHVRGPDDLVPVASYADAVILSDYVREADERFNKGVEPERTVRMLALPMIWKGRREAFVGYFAKRATSQTDYPFLPKESRELPSTPSSPVTEADEILRELVELKDKKVANLSFGEIERICAAFSAAWTRARAYVSKGGV